MKNCIEIKEMISLYIDHQLDDAGNVEFEEHLAQCTSCKDEYKAIMQVIEITGSVQEEELPEGFAQDLHNRLVVEKRNLENRNKTVFIRNRFIKICGSIAAMLVIVVLAKSFFSMYTGGSKSTDSSANVAYELASEMPSAAAAATAASAPAADMSPIIEKKSKGIENGAGAYQDGKDTVENDKDVDVNRKKIEDTKVNPTSKMFTIAAADSTRELKDMKINILVKNIELGVTKVKEQVKAKGGEFLETKMSVGTRENDAPVTTSDSDSVQIVFKIANPQFESLINSLKSAWGEAFVTVGTMNIINVEDKIKQLEADLIELDKKLKESVLNENNIDANEFDKLKIQRDEKQVELDDLNRDTGYLAVCIVLEKR